MAVKLHRLSWSTRLLQNNAISANVKPNGQASINGIIALCRESRMQEALMAFRYMNKERGSIEVDSDVYASLLQACAHMKALSQGYSQAGNSSDALKLFRDMRLAGVKVDSAAIPSVLSSYGQSAALRQGKGIHSYVITCGFDSDVAVENALIDMYARCGCLDDAHQVFRKISQANVISWTAMIAGFGLHGHGEDALRLFQQMQELGMRPNDVTFTVVLSACSHAGLLDKGWQNFNQMSQDYQITPTVEHYACMVDLLGRSGRLDEAKRFIQSMSLEPKPCVWGALLGACRTHCNVELGEYAAENLFKSEPTNAGNYVVLSNIYAAAGRWDGVAKVRTLMRERGLTKKPGCSWIQIRNQMYTFFQGDRSHPQTKKIYATLERLFQKMKESGYAPDTNCVLYEVDNKEKEYILNSHSEKLAIAFGLINTFPGSPILIIKNLRVCNDCHTVTKFISKIVHREITVRDANRFHHFKNGLCSCGDYW